MKSEQCQAMANSFMRQALMSMWRKGRDITPEKFAKFFSQWSDRNMQISTEEARVFLSSQEDFVFNV